MTLFDIHTHTPHNINCDVYSYKYIENTFPDKFNDTLGTHNYFSCGIHPWYASNWRYKLALLEEIANNNSVLAIGECGLDKVRGLSIDLQINIFKAHIKISERVQKPLIIHCVRAWDMLLSIFKESKPTQTWIVHGFRGKPMLAKSLTLSGMSLSFGGVFNSESISVTPIDKIFLETDDSDIDIFDVYNKVAGEMNISIDLLANKVEENVKKVFGRIV